MNKNIRIVLVEPSHPGNIGAVARAMKTMELNCLYLVKPKIFPHVDATARASKADDVLANAVVVDSLADAIKGSKMVFGTSTRIRALSLPTLNPREAAHTITKESQEHTITIVFGRENNGLSNEELDMCNCQIHIPTDPEFYSLNLASAVQLIAYEIRMAKQPNIEAPETSNTKELANAEETQAFYQHLQETLVAIKFLDFKNPRKIMTRLKLIFNRAVLKKNEINILRGILTAIQSKIR
jgi:tRNA (cytidine32/uridine32-2'-O)-methyltransferase